MEFGLKDTDIRIISRILASCPEIEKAIIYGSRAKGNYKPFSDVDITLMGSNLNSSTTSKVWNELEDSLLPYKFDISVYHQISNPDLVDHIQRVGKVFYEKSVL